MAVTSTSVTVDTSATLLFSAGNRTTVKLANTGSVDLYVGGNDGVTADDGFPVVADAVLEVTLDAGESLYGIAASEVDVRVLRAGF